MKLTFATLLTIAALSAAGPITEAFDKRSYCTGFWQSKVLEREVACPPESDLAKRGNCFPWSTKLDARSVECPPEEEAEVAKLLKRAGCTGYWSAKLEARDPNVDCPPESVEEDAKKLHRRSFCTGLWQSKMERDVDCPPS